MSNYRRRYVPGGTYFFTVRLARSGDDTLVRQVDLLRTAVRAEKDAHPFEILEMVVLPDHLHAIWRLPERDSDFSNRWRRIKSTVSRQLPARPTSPSKQRRGEKGIWQRRFWEHQIKSESELMHYRIYCWHNPVWHGYVSRAVDWPYSSFHRAVLQGKVSSDWQMVAPRKVG